jgi:hypothetical protein
MATAAPAASDVLKGDEELWQHCRGVKHVPQPLLLLLLCLAGSPAYLPTAAAADCLVHCGHTWELLGTDACAVLLLVAAR